MRGIERLAVRSWKRAAAVCAVTLAMAVAGWSQGVEHANRITRDLNSGGMVRLAGSVHRLVRRGTDLGEVNPGMQLSSLTLHFGLSAEQQIEMDALTQAQQDPKSPQYHQWLTQEEYGARFGLTNADLKQVTAWLESQGFTVRGVSKSRNSVRFGGKAWQVESAFHTQLHRYELNGEKHFANATELQIPTGLRGVLLVVRGLNDFRPRPQLRRPLAPGYTVNTTQGITNFLSPADWATIYNVNAIYSAGFTGTGAFVGVVGQTYAPQPDIDHFRSASGLSATKLTYVCIDTSVACTGTTAISNQGDLGEADLDIEWAGGIAKNATVVYVYAPWEAVGTSDPVTSQFYDVFDALDHAVSHYTVPATGKVLPVISMSYTDCEQGFNGQPGYVAWITNMGQQANSQGQTIVVSSGDNGAAGCDFPNDFPASMGVSATIPVDSPNYTGVGGTVLNGDESSPGLFWNETLNLVNSAKTYIPEAVWNDTAVNASLSTSSGGVSLFFPKPTWQPTPGNYSGTSGRFVPDVAFAASADHDGYMTCSQDFNNSTTGTDCSSGFVSSKGFFDVVGGTSAGAPSFAGMLTLLDQKYGAQGNLNPTLYQMASDAATYASVFHDITSGNNDVPCVFGTTGCVGGSAGTPGTPGTMGFSATSGYDLTTGLGSIDGGALLAAMGAAGTASAATSTSVSAAPSAALLDVGTVALTATVTSATAGTINGQVTFKVNGTTLGAALLSGETATLSNVAVSTANGFTAGTDTISAEFGGGDSFFAPSTGTTPLTVVPQSEPPPLLSLSQSSATVGGASFTLTVNGVDFAANSKVLWNGALRATTFVNSTQLKATILSSDLANEGTALITVANAAPNAATSAALPFAVMSANPVASITGGSLTVAADGSGNHVLTLTGRDFISASVVTWNGTSLTTGQVSPWQISAVVTASEFSTQPALVTVVNPAGTSAGFTLP